MTWQRFTLYDPYTVETYTFSINAFEGGEPSRRKSVSHVHTTAADGRNIMYEGERPLQEFTLKGVLPDATTRDTLATWAAKEYQLRWTNDLGEERWIYIDNFAPSRKRVLNKPYKGTYDLHAFILDIP